MNLPAHKAMLSAAAAASVLLITAACGSSEDVGTDVSTPAATTTAPSTEPPASAPAASSTGSYADGDYEAEGTYGNPGGVSQVKVELTLAAGKVTDITVTPEASNGTSRMHQEDFAGGIAAVVVGKSIDQLNVSKVAGSSLTSEGFNQAIDAIKDEAKA